MWISFDFKPQQSLITYRYFNLSKENHNLAFLLINHFNIMMNDTTDMN